MMTTLPDCRHDDCYNEDFLTDDNRRVIEGFDFAVEQVEDCIRNIPVGEIGGLLAQKEPTIRAIIKTFKKIIFKELAYYLEEQRNAFITSTIDDMDEDEFKAIRTKVLSENREKEYYDSIHFMCTGEKCRAEDVPEQESEADDDELDDVTDELEDKVNQIKGEEHESDNM